MLFETTAVCAALAAKEELMTLNAAERLIAGSLAFRRSRLQSVEDLKNVGARLEHLGVRLVRALRLDHVGELRREIDGRAFERGRIDDAQTARPGGPEKDGARGGV